GIAGRLWTKMVGSKFKKADLEILKTQLHKYACNEEPYNGSYMSTIDSPTRWWKIIGNGTKDKLGALSSLAVKLFSVCPHAASCERDCRTRLGTKNLESIVKISSYLISNAKKELHYYGLELTKEKIQTVFQDIALFSEDDEEENFNDLDESEDFIDSEVEDQNLEIENLITLNII
ncbi:4862_t:CDS:2, partial [Dentiscutata erythropus]